MAYRFDDGIPERLPDARDLKNRKAHHRKSGGDPTYNGQHGTLHGQAEIRFGGGASLRNVPRRIYNVLMGKAHAAV